MQEDIINIYNKLNLKEIFGSRRQFYAPDLSTFKSDLFNFLEDAFNYYSFIEEYPIKVAAAAIFKSCYYWTVNMEIKWIPYRVRSSKKIIRFPDSIFREYFHTTLFNKINELSERIAVELGYDKHYENEFIKTLEESLNQNKTTLKKITDAIMYYSSILFYSGTHDFFYWSEETLKKNPELVNLLSNIGTKFVVSALFAYFTDKKVSFREIARIMNTSDSTIRKYYKLIWRYFDAHPEGLLSDKQ